VKNTPRVPGRVPKEFSRIKAGIGGYFSPDRSGGAKLEINRLKHLWSRSLRRSVRKKRWRVHPRKLSPCKITKGLVPLKKQGYPGGPASMGPMGTVVLGGELFLPLKKG
jgi:hypothetical protein